MRAKILPLKSSILSTIRRLAEKELDEEELEEKLEEIGLILISNDVAYETVQDILERLKEELRGRRVRRGKIEEFILSSLKRTLKELLEGAKGVDLIQELKKARAEGKVLRVVFLGVNGVGKTLTIAKVARRLMMTGFKPVIAAADTFRAGAIEQLENYASEVGVEVVSRKYGSDPASVVYDAVQRAIARGMDAVLADTAGRMHTNVNLVEELRKILRIAGEPQLKILVLDALSGNDVLYQAKYFMDHVGFDGMIFTKVDANAKCGGIITAVHQTHRPILFIGTGQSYDDLEEFRVDAFLSEILG